MNIIDFDVSTLRIKDVQTHTKGGEGIYVNFESVKGESKFIPKFWLPELSGGKGVLLDKFGKKSVRFSLSHDNDKHVLIASKIDEMTDRIKVLLKEFFDDEKNDVFIERGTKSIDVMPWIERASSELKNPLFRHTIK